jgi:hypothetical protein
MGAIGARHDPIGWGSVDLRPTTIREVVPEGGGVSW